jgi:hypothetical protein
MEKIIDYAKEIGLYKQPKRRMGTNQDGDENEERRRRTDKDTHEV